MKTGPAAAPSPWVVFSAVAVGNLMATLDGSIVNVALPTLSLELAAPVDRVEWIVSAYLVAISATLLAAGRLGDAAGHRPVYVGGLLVFTIGSALCGLSGSLGGLVAARVVQALGATAMMAIGPAIVTAVFPASMRGRALGAIGTVVAVGLTLGPPLGGAILTGLSWRWLFFVNVPVGIAGMAWALRTLPARRGGGVGPRPPLVPLRLFRSPVFAAGIAAGLLSYAAMFSQTILTPFFLARAKGLGPGRLGLMLSAVPVALSVSSPLAGWLSDRLGGRFLPPLGMLLVAGGLAGLAGAEPEDGLPTIAAWLAACGFGMGLFQAPNNSAVMGATPRDLLGSGGGLLATARNVGMACGVALSARLFAWRAGSSPGVAELLLGWSVALRAGAGIALLAGAASLAAPRRPEPPLDGGSGSASMRP
ncbi:MAG TPA: MFS transporter [Anaeromyxobacteraceae bacterium]|nr:MFS transporter [Anaeromyxobacteraceae bacterium]